MQIEFLLEQGKHQEIQSFCTFLIEKKFLFAHYFLARSQFLCYKFDEGFTNIEKFLDKFPYHEEGIYLKIEFLTQLGNKELAKNLAKELLSWSKRGKNWQVLANLVENKNDFEDYLSRLEKNYGDISNISYDIAHHLTQVAYRMNCVDIVYQWWLNKYQTSKNFSSNELFRRKIKRYSTKNASIALGELKRCFDDNQVYFFLISGTFLGCIREGKLLEHDKDIDVGVWADKISYDELELIFRQSGFFYILPTSNQDVLVVRHLNGTTIDVFFHQKVNDQIWHSGEKCKWYNSNFELVYYNFLGQQYLVPKDYDRYLTENYGDDWRIPKIDFDSALDTPNMQVIDNKKMVVYFCKKLLNSNFNGSAELRERLYWAIKFYNDKVKVDDEKNSI